MPTDIIYCLVWLTHKKDKLIATGEIECYVPAKSRMEASVKLKKLFSDSLHLEITFPEDE
jgi:hypothetical protein